MANFISLLKLISGASRKLVAVTAMSVLFWNLNAQSVNTIADVVVNSENHTTLEAAVVAAGLVDALKGEGPFTLFAPTDAAFAALPAGTIPALLADPSGALTDILKYHVVSGSVKSTDLSDGTTAKTLLGKDITVTINANGVFINNARVTVADIMTDNGVVHVVDAVLLPSEPATVWDIISGSPSHETLEAAVEAAGLDGALSGEGNFTVFAPTDAAFAALPEGVVEALLADPSGDLTTILLTHVLNNEYLAGELANNMTILTLSTKGVDITINANGVFVNGSKVIKTDMKAGNGVVHVIDAVIVPPRDLQIVETEKFGKVITDDKGRTLYFLSRDALGKSECFDACLDNWPVFYASNLLLPEGLDKEDFGYIMANNGRRQSTYKGWPLYYYAFDNPGDINGDGRSNVWFVAKPDYSVMLVNNQLKGSNGVNYMGDYTPGDQVVQYFSDGYGRTLYTWTRDFSNTNKFTKSDFSNNATWPIYEETNLVLPSILDKTLFNVIDVYGRKQLTYKGWPLYYFGGDMMTRGNTKGVSVPMPGVWPVAVKDIGSPVPATVVDVVVNSENHTTLEAAVVAAGLVDALSGDGPFTLFAPTDAAFAALPAGTIPALLADPSGALTDILKYHVLAGTVKSTDLSDGLSAMTLLGKGIKVTINAQGVFINNAKVTVADIMTDNGVVHVIDAVLIPQITSADNIDSRSLNFRLYPNPATSKVTVEFDSGNFNDASTLSILSLDGRKLDEIEMNTSRFLLDVSKFISGIYLMVLKNGDRVQTGRLVIR